MSKAQTDNSFFDIKVKLRLDNLPKKNEIWVLDCFCGNGLIWQRIQQLRPNHKIKMLGIDKKTNTKKIHLIGNNLQFLSALNLSKFDIVDLDAYGVPYKQLRHILNAQPTSEDLTIYVTFIQSQYGSLPTGMLKELGYTESMMSKIPTLFYRHGFEKFKQWLAQKGIRKINYYVDKTGRKYYISIKKVRNTNVQCA
jgi:hypothetical protein